MDIQLNQVIAHKNGNGNPCDTVPQDASLFSCHVLFERVPGLCTTSEHFNLFACSTAKNLCENSWLYSGLVKSVGNIIILKIDLENPSVTLASFR